MCIRDRINTILPEIMKREKIDMWIVVAREYNEDPVMLSLLPSPMITARRRTILVFFKKDDGTIERLCISPVSYTHLDVYKRQVSKKLGWILCEAFFTVSEDQEKN